MSWFRFHSGPILVTIKFNGYRQRTQEVLTSSCYYVFGNHKSSTSPQIFYFSVATTNIRIKQDRQRKYKATLRLFSRKHFCRESAKVFYMSAFVCAYACVRVCVCVRGRVGVCVCEHACSITQHAKCTRRIIFSCLTSKTLPFFDNES
jgi:hypothetical protein